MDRDSFKKLLLDSTNAALAFARKFVFNLVADNVGYVVEFNDNVNVAMKCPTLEAAVDRLWHDGRIPVWIDINVHDVERRITTVWLLASERHVTEFSDTFYACRGTGPFCVKSPVIPPPVSWLPIGTTHRFFLGNSWLCWQLNCLIFRWWAFWGGCDAATMRFYRENRWKKPKARKVEYVGLETT